MIAQSEVVPYLLERNLLRPECVVDEDLRVIETSRRNHSFAVVRDRGPCYLLKQGIGTDRVMTVSNEAAIYQLLQSHGEKTGLDRYFPYFYEYDSNNHILILEWVNGAQNLREYHLNRGRFAISPAIEMGNALGGLHQLIRLENEDRYSVLQSQTPWIFSVYRPGLEIFRDFSSANIQLIKIIQQFPELCQLLDGLRDEWKTETYIHFDIKGDNCIVFSKSPSKRKSGLKLVDWELSTIGDPCWDIGSFFSHFLSFWLLSIPISGETASPDRLLDLARYPIDKMQPAIRSFWQAYIRQMELDDATANQWLIRGVKFAAARMIQTVFEQMQMSVQLTGNVICSLQVSLNILRRPRESIIHLLGIPL
ncbi:phosphotransferase family protein [Bacillus thuringiensis]|uniref:phosphotransferase family protein n=1 Tax=Bacillus thuringiensis TaxID=1428 RepID=UPI001874B89A|nr:phosphotransferase [Bacillus thuringiensis]MBE5096795.1 phosphotransferase [Bacillus thuringiensis]